MLKLKPGVQKWIVFGSLYLAGAATTIAQYQISAQSVTIMEVFGLTQQQYSSVYNAPSWVAVFGGLIGGVIADKVGARKIVSIASIFTVAGCVMRMMAGGYQMLFWGNLLIGVLAMFATVNRSKLFQAWFTPDQVPMLMGICLTVTPVFSTLTLLTSGAFSNLQSLFLFPTIMVAVFVVLWLICVQDAPEGVELPPSPPVLEPLKAVIKNPYVWIGGVAGFCTMIAQVCCVGFLVAGLTARGISQAVSAGITTALTIGMGVGAVVTPVIAKKIGRYRPVIALYGILGTLAIFFCYRLDSRVVIYILLLIAGIAIGSYLTFVQTFPSFYVAPQNIASGVGLSVTCQLLGAAYGVTYVIIPLSGGDYTKIFTLGAAAFAIASVFWFICPDVGPNGRLAQERLAAQASQEEK